MNGLFDKISKNRPNFSNSYRKVADFLTEHYEDASFLTALKIAQGADVSESVVIRFAKSIGYSGFPEMKADLQKEVRKNMSLSQRMRKINMEETSNEQEVFQMVMTQEYNNVLRTMKDPFNLRTFSDVATMIADADTVYVLAVRALESASSMLVNLLGVLGKRVFCINPERSMDMSKLFSAGENDVAIAISFSRYDKRIRMTQEYLKERNVKLITVADRQDTPDVELADKVLFAAIESYSYTNSYCALFALFNAIVAAVSLQNKDLAISNLDLMERLGMMENYID